MKKILLITLSFIINTFILKADPCTSIISVTCGNIITFNSNAAGDPAWDNNMSCNYNSSQGGLEQIYLFIAPQDGYYQIQTLSASGSDVLYSWKDTLTGCNATNWTCLPSGNGVSAAGFIGAINLTAGQTIYILLNATGTNLTTHQFQIICANNICDSIQTVTCGTAIQFNSLGYGNQSFDNNHSCNYSSSQGGQEKIYRFNPPVTGYYQIQSISVSGNDVLYSWKDTLTGCTSTNWSCFPSGNGVSSAGAVGAVNLNANQTIYILANATGTGVTSSQFQINCANNICDSIQTVTCGTAIQFNSLGYGNQSFDNNHSCNYSSSQGGQEKIYRFNPPVTGYYQIQSISVSGNDVLYSWKDTLTGCTSTNWSCFPSGNGVSSAGAVGAVNLNANQTIYILANATGIGVTSAQFQINCANSICDSIQTVTCGTAIQFNSLGYGNQSFDNNHSCNYSSSQGGQEKIYRFNPPVTGYYQIQSISVSGNDVLYSWKDTLTGCTSTNWSCFPSGNGVSSAGAVGAVNLNANQTIYILANATGIGVASAQFQINCANSICDSIQTVTCGTAIQFNSLGYGNQSFDNNHSCNYNSSQGGQEQIYHLPYSNNGYQITVSAGNGGAVIYSWKYDSLGCNSNNWNCLGNTSNTATYAFNPALCSNVLLLVNSTAIGAVNSYFQVACNQCPVGISETSLETNFGIFPNPASDKLTIKLSDQINFSSTLSIYNVIGEILYEQKITNSTIINISNFKSGIYLVQISNDKGVTTKRFVKE